MVYNKIFNNNIKINNKYNIYNRKYYGINKCNYYIKNKNLILLEIT